MKPKTEYRPLERLFIVDHPSLAKQRFQSNQHQIKKLGENRDPSEPSGRSFDRVHRWNVDMVEKLFTSLPSTMY